MTEFFKCVLINYTQLLIWVVIENREKRITSYFQRSTLRHTYIRMSSLLLQVSTASHLEDHISAQFGASM